MKKSNNVISNWILPIAGLLGMMIACDYSVLKYNWQAFVDALSRRENYGFILRYISPVLFLLAYLIIRFYSGVKKYHYIERMLNSPNKQWIDYCGILITVFLAYYIYIGVNIYALLLSLFIFVLILIKEYITMRKQIKCEISENKIYHEKLVLLQEKSNEFNQSIVELNNLNDELKEKNLKLIEAVDELKKNNIALNKANEEFKKENYSLKESIKTQKEEFYADCGKCESKAILKKLIKGCNVQ